MGREPSEIGDYSANHRETGTPGRAATAQAKASVSKDGQKQGYFQAVSPGEVRSAELSADLWSILGNICAQNDLLNDLNNKQNSQGATLYIGDWDPIGKSWDPGDII